jgi:hypothetical protein
MLELCGLAVAVSLSLGGGESLLVPAGARVVPFEDAYALHFEGYAAKIEAQDVFCVPADDFKVVASYRADRPEIF